jgi:hypothetical protein
MVCARRSSSEHWKSQKKSTPFPELSVWVTAVSLGAVEGWAVSFVGVGETGEEPVLHAAKPKHITIARTNATVFFLRVFLLKNSYFKVIRPQKLNNMKTGFSELITLFVSLDFTEASNTDITLAISAGSTAGWVPLTMVSYSLSYMTD